MNPQALLENMGWKQGQGLGRRNQGILTVIKPKVQFDRNGLGLNSGVCLVEPWWAKMYNQTAQNISITESNESSDGESSSEMPVKDITVKKQKKSKQQNLPNASTEVIDTRELSTNVKLKELVDANNLGKQKTVQDNTQQNPVIKKSKKQKHAERKRSPTCEAVKNCRPSNGPQRTLTSKKPGVKKKSITKSSVAPDFLGIKCSMYKHFIKSTTLRADDFIKPILKDSLDSTSDDQKAQESLKFSNCQEIKARKNDMVMVNPIDNSMWQNCEGRTAHEGARYGVLKGKLARLMRQENQHKIFTSAKVPDKAYI